MVFFIFCIFSQIVLLMENKLQICIVAVPYEWLLEKWI